MGDTAWAGRLLQALGVLLVVLVMADVFYTVLFPASGHGPIRRPLSKGTWRCFALLARRLPDQRRRQLLAYSGPVQVAVTIVVWVTVLPLGWAVLYQPALGHGIRAAHGATDTSFATALYFSGFSLTTLGTGDVVAVTSTYRLLGVAEAALGFSVFTMVLTYFLSIYNALVARKSFSGSLHHRTFDTGVPVQLLVGLAGEVTVSQAREQLTSVAGFLTHTAETHRSYPVLRYFHFRRHRYAVPRLLLIGLDSVALVQAGFAGDRYSALIRSSAVYELASSSLEVLEELAPGATTQAPSDDDIAQWHRRFRRCLAELRAAGVEVVEDVDRGARDYVALRQRWDAPLRALSADMLYDWYEIDVMRP